MPPSRLTELALTALLFCTTLVHSLPAPPFPFIFSATQSGDMSQPNRLLQFAPHNISQIFNSVPYDSFEDTLGEVAYDPATHRIFLYTEEFTVNVYDAVTLSPVGTLDLPFQSYPGTQRNALRRRHRPPVVCLF